jgi:hypothetical protein
MVQMRLPMAVKKAIKEDAGGKFIKAKGEMK